MATNQRIAADRQAWVSTISFSNKPLGDEGAVAIARVISDRSLTRAEVEMVLTLLQDSFSDVGQIQPASNRQPRAALLLLRYLEYSADDPELKKEIAETRKLLAKASALPEK